MLLALLPLQLLAEEPPHVRVDLVSSVQTATAGDDFEVIFRQDIDAGWHTYWLNPGDSGAPPEIAWEAVPGIEISEFRWPVPKRIAYGPLMNFGYKDEVLLPFTVMVAEDFSGDTVTLNGSGRVLVCADICIPEKVQISLAVPIGPQPVVDSSVTQLFRNAAGSIPVQLPTKSTLMTTQEGLTLLTGLEVPPGNRIESVAFFPKQPDLINNPAEQTFQVVGGQLQLMLQPGFEFEDNPPETAPGLLVITEEAGGMLVSSYEISPVVADSSSMPAESETASGAPSLLTAMLFAFLGGMILNLMPCVFPVLSIKVLSLVEASGEGGKTPLSHGLAYSAGVIISFVAVALLLVALRSAGEVIGWGFQLQSPLVVGALAYLFVLIALNLLGLFEVGTSIMSLGSGGGDNSHSFTSSFSTGVLATVVAAPCTAPFMGAAVGYALTQSMPVIMVVFAALGLGMAVPFLLLCVSPAILNRLPRPGPWMVNLKQFLAFPMLASAIWLIWVLGIQVGATGMMQIMAGGLLLGLGFWALGAGRTSWQWPARVVLLLCVLSAGYLLIALPEPARPSVALASGESSVTEVAVDGVQAYSEAALAEARAAGPVFVNFTAAWCITCKVNEANALNRSAVREAFAERGITYLRGDWTNEDPVITRALEEYGRSGVPLYLFYRAGAERAELLPQLLTESIVLDQTQL